MQTKFLGFIDKEIDFPSIISVGTDCSGIDSILSALKYLGIDYQLKFASDIDKDVKKSHVANYTTNKFYDNISTRNHSELPYIDLYVAGFPCQSFSLLGNRRGFESSTIFFDCLKTIQNTKPKIFILENVKGLINHDNGKTFETILSLLNQLKNYSIYWDVYNTKQYGIPQNRERIFIIGLDKNYFNDFKKPIGFPLELSTSDLIDKSIIANKKLTEHQLTILSDLSSKIKLNEDWILNLNVSSYKRASPMKHISPTLLAGCVYYSTLVSRKLTPREYLRLQGFPEDFKIVVSDRQMYKQVGNSISVNVLCFILMEIFRCKKQI